MRVYALKRTLNWEHAPTNPKRDNTQYKGSNSTDLTLDEVTRAARRLGYALRPWVDRQQGNRGFNNGGPSRYQNGGNPQQGPKFNQNGNSVACTQNPVRRQTPIGEVKCWTCGKTGHYASDCKTNGPKFCLCS